MHSIAAKKTTVHLIRNCTGYIPRVKDHHQFHNTTTAPRVLQLPHESIFPQCVQCLHETATAPSDRRKTLFARVCDL